MSKALLEIMEPYMEPILLEREKQARIKGAIESLRDFNISENDIKEAIMRNYHLSEEEAISYL